MFSLRMGRRGLGAVAALALTATLAPAVNAEQALPLQPGEVVGSVQNYVVKPGDTLEKIAPGFGVHPVRITKPSNGLLKGGLKPGETIFVDRRRIQPVFASWVSGIVLNVPEAEVYYVENGRLVKSYPVAVSQTDWKVPIGEFKIVDMEVNPTWHVPKRIQAEMARKGEEVKTEVKPGPDNPLGSRWIGFADGTYGFHGTIAPSTIKHYASHGCVRFLKADIEDLYRRVSKNTPVRVYYQPVLLAVDLNEVWLSAYPDVYRQDFDYTAAAKQLIEQAGVTERINWSEVERAIKARDGFVYNISRAPAPSASASPR